ncbi:hypothetical protein C8Q77DRAFT_535431 [Trametes polyzona]|nr:hypothetical protein C8Q77DRAFT_535431 [Trametes polyzona]
MPRIDPPYPSFTFVLTAPPPRTNASSRLPAYRASHMGRYHPYPRVAPGRCQDRLMNTIDYRYVEEPLWEEDAADVQRVGATGCEGDSISTNASHPTPPSPTADATSQNERVESSSDGASAKLSRSKLVDTLTEMLFALRRRYLTVQAVKNFLKAEDLKRA